MNSSETASAVLVALWVVASLLLSSAQMRVTASATSRRVRYLVGWLACALVLGALLSAMDGVTGRSEMTRRAANFALTGIVCAAGLAAGEWWTRRPAWVATRRAARFLTLVLIHALVVLITAYPFI